jgi:protein-disulfide isomerase
MIEKIYKNEDYINQQTQAIDSTLEQFAVETESNTPSESNDDVSAVVENLLATAPIHGDKDARFTIIEYTELLCPYCQRHSTNGTIEAVMEKFPGEVNSISRHYIIHGQTALELAAAMECVAELKSEVYYDVFKKAFEAYPVDMDTLKNIATEL